MTYLPYQISLIDENLLEDDEIEYLNEYNSKVKELLLPFLKSKEEKEYLQRNTEKLDKIKTND